MQLILPLMPSAAHTATTYTPKEYVTDVLSYYPSITSIEHVREIIAIKECYAFLPKHIQLSAAKKVELLLIQSLPAQERSRIMVEEIGRDTKVMTSLPEDIRQIIIQERERYDSLPSEAKEKLALLQLTGDRTLLEDPYVMQYINSRD